MARPEIIAMAIVLTLLIVALPNLLLCPAPENYEFLLWWVCG